MNEEKRKRARRSWNELLAMSNAADRLLLELMMHPDATADVMLDAHEAAVKRRQSIDETYVHTDAALGWPHINKPWWRTPR